MARLSACVALVLVGKANAAVHDVSSMVQRDASSLEPQYDALNLNLAELGLTLKDVKQASTNMQEAMPEVGDDLQQAAHQIQDIDEGRRDRLAETWKLFEEKAQAAKRPDPAS